jgi:5-methylcytosine-specific restriction endonuclease McrA
VATCRSGSCTRARVSGSQYCNTHVCQISFCVREQTSTGNLCSAHRCKFSEWSFLGPMRCRQTALVEFGYCGSHSVRR